MQKQLSTKTAKPENANAVASSTPVAAQPAEHPGVDPARQLGNRAFGQWIQERSGLLHQSGFKLIDSSPQPGTATNLAFQTRFAPLGPRIQTKAAVNQPGDRYEQEADGAAAHVMSMPDSRLDAGSVASPEPAVPSRRDPGIPSTPSAVHDVLGESGRPLDSSVRAFMEPRFGHDFSQVRVHSGSAANQSSSSIGAQAYTVGTDVVLAKPENDFSSPDTRRLVAHELAHVVQQSPGTQRSQSQSLAASLSRVSAGGIQRKLFATGESAGFVTIANAIIGVQFELQVGAAGEVTIHATNVQGPPTRDALELINTLRTAIDDAKPTTIEFIRGATSTRASDRNVIVGNYDLSRIDLDDVEAFGMTSSHSRQGDNAAVQLVHEITEQYRKQVHGEAFPVAHQAGYRAQERLLGATLVNETPMTPIGGDLGEVTTTYRYPGGREVDVITTINFATGQITGVRRVIRP